MCALWAAHHQQQFASFLNAVKVVRLRAECQRSCLDIDSNGVRVHVKCSMRCVPLWLHAISYLFADTPKFFSFQKPTNPINKMSSNNKSTTLSISDIPRFNGRNFQGWSEKMIGIFMMAKVYNIVNGTTTKPADMEAPVAPTEPAEITVTVDSTAALRSSAMWSQYNIRMSSYHHLTTKHNWKIANWNDANSQAMGILNRALDIGIWDQIKDKTAKRSWDWLKEKYAKQSHLELMEHFCFIKDQKIDLSNPNPQLTLFMHHYQAILDAMISPQMATIILLSNLPLTTNPGQESVYQRLLESNFREETIASMDLTGIIQQICDVWAARFGGFHQSQQPRKGATYDRGKAPANKLQQKQQMQVQRNTAIKGKGPNPQYSEQQSADSGSSQQKKKQPFQRGGKGKGAHSHVAGAPDTYNSNFVLASAAMHIADTPAPTAHSVTSFSAAGPSTRREKAMGPWKNPGQTTPPYPHVQRSRDLMSCLGVTPTIQTLKEFEGIASLEEVTDRTFGAPTVKLGAYTLQDPELETPAFRWGAYSLTDPIREPPRAPTPEMAPMLDAMVIDVPSEEEDMVSLGEEDPIPEGSGLFGDDKDDAPLPQGLKLNLDDDTSDYGDDPETLCGPIIEPAPTPVAGPSRTKRRAWETRGPQPYKRWSDDHDAYEGPTDNELVPFCSHKGTLLTDPTLASSSLDIGRSLDKYLAANITCDFVSLCADCKDNSKSNFIE